MANMEGITATPASVNDTADSMAPELNILKAKADKFGGVIIDTEDLPTEPSFFLARLKQSLIEWKNEVASENSIFRKPLFLGLLV